MSGDNLLNYAGDSGFASVIAGAQGGGYFGADRSPRHPSQATQARSPASYRVVTHYKQFDLSVSSDVEELEDTLNLVYNAEPGTAGIRHERLANDKDGYTIVTLSWYVLEPKNPPKKHPPRVDPEGRPYKLQQQYPYPTIEDEEAVPEGYDTPTEAEKEAQRKAADEEKDSVPVWLRDDMRDQIQLIDEIDDDDDD